MSDADENPVTDRRGALSTGALLGLGVVSASLATTSPASAASFKADRYARGMAALRRISGERGAQVVESLRDIAPDLGRYIVEFAFGDVYSRPWLSPRQRQLVTVGALTAFGDTAPQLRVHIGAALNVGLSRAQVIEALIHTVSYAGFPRVLNAMNVAREVFEDR